MRGAAGAGRGGSGGSHGAAAKAAGDHGVHPQVRRFKSVENHGVHPQVRGLKLRKSWSSLSGEEVLACCNMLRGDVFPCTRCNLFGC